jgi:HEAT repeat protein
MKRYVCVLAGLLFAAGVVWGQQPSDSERKREPTIEELYLQAPVEMIILKSQADSEAREMKLLALQNIREMIETGAVSENDLVVHDILDSLALEGITRQIRENRRLLNDFPEVRRTAANLLGRLGGERAKDSLLYVLRHENEPMVLSEAVYALGQIGLNENDEVSRAVVVVLQQQDIRNPDNNLAYASMLAIEKLGTQGDGVKDPAVFTELINIAQGNYIRDVKLKAADLLQELREY